jgi:SRSO17 transposase
MAVPQAGTEPLPDLSCFLTPFSHIFLRAESRHALERYTTGLMANLPHKTASAMGRSLPGTNGQRLQELLTRTSWEAKDMDRLRIQHMNKLSRVGKGALIFDDTGFPKKGQSSVGVGRQYSGTLGRVDNCQVLVTSHYVDQAFDWPVNAQLYLPQDWSKDPERRSRAQVPEEIPFRTKGEIALSLFDEALAAGLEVGAVVADAGYGDQSPFLKGLETRQQPYAVAVPKKAMFRDALAVETDSGEAQPVPYQGQGRPRKPKTLADRIPAVTAEELIDALPETEWQEIAWRQGTKGALIKQFVTRPVYRSGHRGTHLDIRGLLIGERPMPGHAGDSKYYFVWELDEIDLPELVALLHVRWTIERFYQDAKGELGLDDYEGRLWPGFHRHVALVMLAHSFLTLQRSYGPSDKQKIPISETSPGLASDSGAFPPSESEKHRRPAAPCPGGIV